MSESYMSVMRDTSYLDGGNAAYLEEMYEQYLTDPSQLSAEWRQYFAAMQPTNDVSHKRIQQEFLNLGLQPKRAAAATALSQDAEMVQKQVHVTQLIDAYRARGHQRASLDPLGMADLAPIPCLELEYYGLTNADLNTVFNTDNLFGTERATLADIITQLKQTYCNTIGAEFTYITDIREKEWIQRRFEAAKVRQLPKPEQRAHILEKLTAAEGLERYLHAKYVGQKRFSLEGAESLIPMMDEIIQRAAAQNVKEIVIGMAHRGRLNVLVNVLGKTPRVLFEEFEGKHQIEMGTGDVKYHQGFSSNIMTTSGQVHLALAFNPSHLEIVSPVVEGSVRARQDRRSDKQRNSVLPISIHGDSAFAGQGVVMETFNMSQVRGFKTGGTIHLVVNNQIGFTTSNPADVRSTMYCTDVAKMVQAPVFHVNADDPDAVIFVTQLALDYRMTFQQDVVIDLVCYRRHGHNEADEPSITQPMMYEKIRQHATTRSLYAEQLIKAGVITKEHDDALVAGYRRHLDIGDNVVKVLEADQIDDEFATDWSPYSGKHWTAPVDTRVPVALLQDLEQRLQQIPQKFSLHPQVNKLLEHRGKMLAGELPFDWGCAENLAYATLLMQGVPIRLSGQDSGRGTFAHRHAVFNDQKNGDTYVPLRNIAAQQPEFLVIDSLLSEEAVLAFEYGYASADPHTLVIWEAQFGDFANGAQVVIDQFISSGEHKWGRLCGLVMLLPHGYEGMGPEHSSARLERFLQLCAEHNIQVCVPTTPAQAFHMLRRQALRPYRKPLVVMSPKSLLRHKLATSTLEEVAQGSFQPVIGEIDTIDPKLVKKMILCSGKVYFDLLSKRRADKIIDVALVRIEQLYPFPEDQLRAQIALYPNLTKVVWCQEEPMNQGAWYCSQHHIRNSIGQRQELLFAGREASAAPAVGALALHVKQQAALVEQAFAI